MIATDTLLLSLGAFLHSFAIGYAHPLLERSQYENFFKKKLDFLKNIAYTPISYMINQEQYIKF